GRRLRRRRPRSDLLLQLEDDALRGLLADPGNRLEPGRVLEGNRAPQVGGTRPRDDRERDLRADPADGEKGLDQLALCGVGEAVQLEGVLADVRVDLERDLARAVRFSHRARGDRDQVADAIDVEDEAVGTMRDRRSTQARDHDATAFESGDASAWQIATASASEACVDSGGAPRATIVCPIRATWPFSARPWPHTACFTRLGAYPAHSTPARAEATSTAPRA